VEITSDILLRGTAWNRAINELGPIFTTRTNYSIYMLSLAIGVMYDQKLEAPVENGEDVRTVPRTVIVNNDNGKLDFYFQAAILSTSSVTIDEEKRLELAFGEKVSFNKIAFLTQFANFGVTKLVELIGDTPLESMDKIKNFMVSTVEGRNFEIDDLAIDDLTIDEIDLFE